MAKRRKIVKTTKTKIPGSSNWIRMRSEIKENEKLTVKKVRKSNSSLPELSVKENSVVSQVSSTKSNVNSVLLSNRNLSSNITQRLALDCEMVGTGKDGTSNQLARVSIVNVYGDIIYDKIVTPRENVTDYRTAITGLTKIKIKAEGIPFKQVQQEVAEIIKNKVVIGHDIKHDFDALEFSHPRHLIRDTAKYKPFKELSKGNTPSLKKLSKEILSVDIQKGEHDSTIDAKCALQLYKKHRAAWERSLKKLKKRVENNITATMKVAEDSVKEMNELNDD